MGTQTTRLRDPATAPAFAPYIVNPFQLYPLSQRSYTGTNGTNLTGTDVDLDELGLGQIANGLRVGAYSANRGTIDDTALIRIVEPGTEVYIAVVGANGEFSNVEPYALQVEASTPFDSLALAAGRTDLFGGACRREPLGGTTTTRGDFVDEGEHPTLFVTSWERLESTTDQPEAVGVAEESVKELLGAVGGAILDLGGDVFAEWDAATCDVDAANEVADFARDQVREALLADDYEHVVVVGGDDVVPFRRVVDETKYANEVQYATSSFLTPGQPIFAGLAGGFNLTDNHLGDIVPTPWRGRDLWISDVPTARMVETEIEIAGQARAFLDGDVDGQLDLGTAFVTGSEFFADGSTAVAAALGATKTLIDDSANATDYRCELFGVDADGTPCEASESDVNVVNAHYQHFATFSPVGASNADPAEVIPTTAVNDKLLGSLFVTIGCHGGLPVPDDEAQDVDLGAGLDTSLDWAQALARQNAVMIANTGFGLGDNEGLGYSELLQLFIAEDLATAGPGVTVGEVVLAAQQRYLTSVTQFDEYHEKTMVQTTVYGLPFYEITGGDVVTTESAPAAFAAATSTASTQGAPPFPFDTFNTAGGDIAVSATIGERSIDGRGSYYFADANGSVLETVDRPKQALVVARVPDDVTGEGPAHGVLIRHDGDAEIGAAGQYLDVPNSDPLIYSPTSEWLSDAPERQTCLDAWWPSTLAQLNTHELGGDELLQTVSIKPNQFRCTSAQGTDVRGTQRLFDDLPVQLLRSNSDDWQAPVIRQVDFEEAAEAGSLLVSMVIDAATLYLPDSDNPGLPDYGRPDLAEIVVLRLLDGVVRSEIQDFEIANQGTTVTFTLDELQGDEGFLIQLVDGSNNVTTYTGKSTVPSYIKIEATGPDVAFPGEPVTLTATIPGYADKIDPLNGVLVAPVWYSWEFGAPVTYQDPVTLQTRTVDRISGLVDPNGVDSGGLFISTNYDPPDDDPDTGPTGDAVIKVTVTYDDTAPDPIVATTRVVDSDGGVGVDRHTMRRACDAADLPEFPDADLVTCGLDFDVLTPDGEPGLGFTVGVAGDITDEFQYRINFDTDANGGADKTVKYQKGKLSGPLDATFVIDEVTGDLLITFALTDVATACPDDPSKQCVYWFVETQGGIQSGEGLGFLDRMRDDFTITEVPTSL